MADKDASRVAIWDVPVRLFHWLLVALLGFSWWSGERHDMEWHRWSGYAILTLLIFRIYWGFVGGRTARFAHFVRGPRTVAAYARSRAKAPTPPGHTPLGGWSVILMLAALGMMVLAGLFAVDVDGLESGPLADYISFDQGRTAAEIHGIIFNVLLFLTALHMLAIVFYLVRGKNLIGPMLTGTGKGDATQALHASWPRALLGIALAISCAALIARGFRL
jgi:cytochrome b